MMQRQLTFIAVLGLAVAGCGGDDTTSVTSADMATAGSDLAQVGDMAQAPADMTPPPAPSKKVIVFVWDGLRPDSVTQADTPNLYAMQQAGVNFSDNHSTYPTFTMMNGAAFATGSFPGTTGFYGNSLWAPGAVGANSSGAAQDFVDPVFTEDYAILQDLDTYYNNKLLLVGTLFQAAQAKGLTTAAVGKSGPAFLQDYRKGGYILDEKMVWPLSLVKEIQGAGDVLPATTPFAYAPGQMTLGSVNGNPTGRPAKVTLNDKATGDPTAAQPATPSGANLYLLQTYLNHVLPKAPDLTLVWFRSPDSPEHDQGPGSPTYHDALKNQDFLLGQLQAALKSRGWDKTTDIIVVSDHGHSSVSGAPSLFPLRAITSGAVGATDPNGWSASGDVRLADLLSRAGGATPTFPNVYDGNGCMYVPAMSGIKADNTPVYPTLPFDTTCAAAKTSPTNPSGYTTKAFLVPAGALPAGAVVIATNGGSDYLYVPDHSATVVQNLVTFLQKREEVGAIFLNSAYGSIAGTLPMSMVKLENAGRAPDIIIGYDFDENAMVAGVPGIEYESMSSSSNRGMHGSFSPRDVHNTLLAIGPDFKTTLVDTLPTGNVDVAPTVAQIFGLSLPGANGRPLLEALANGGAAIGDYTATPSTVNPTAAATGLTFQVPTDPTGATTDSALTAGTYTINLKVKTLTKGTQSWTYFDSAKAVRQ
jgi:predicted AlkP superfamily pyrophosphatase or phosphodiesterase